jgi:hypothetical protein
MSELKIQYPNTITFKFSPRIIKVKKAPSKSVISGTLICTAIKTSDGKWEAHVNTKHLQDYKDITVLPFSEGTFNLKGKNDIFSINPDNKGHYTRIMLDNIDCMATPETSSMWTTLRDKHLFKGKIIKIDGQLFFNIKEYIGKELKE